LKTTRGVTLIEAVVVVAVLAILVALSVPLYQEHILHRSLRNAAHLIQGDLRLAQQTAVARAGSGPAVEMCFRTTGTTLDGYDVYTLQFTDPLNPGAGTSLGATIKAASAGGQFRSGLSIAFEAGLARPCFIDATRMAVAFSGGGDAIFADTDPVKDISVSSGGLTRRVTLVGVTGRVTVVEP
jgi:type II secretory pathway pseudopilin PulG